MAATVWNKLLNDAETCPFTGTLVRCVPQLTFAEGTPPSYLFTSGRRQRCNPEGVHCLYMAEERETALAEYDSYFVDPQPHVVYHGNLNVRALLDLAHPANRESLGLDDKDFFESFRLKRRKTPLQSLGEAVSKQTTIAAVRFPSRAMRDVGKQGFNIVVFRLALTSPDESLQILGPSGTILEEWP